MEVQEAIKERRSSRKFSRKKIPHNTFAKILETVRHAPMAGNIPSIRLVVIESDAKKAAISQACAEQLWMQEASHLVVVCSAGVLTRQNFGEFSDSFLKQQAGAAIQNMLLQATELEIANCWVGAFDADAIKSIIEAPASAEVEAVLVFGYAAEKPFAKKVMEKFGKKKNAEDEEPKKGWKMETPRKIDTNSITSFEIYGRWHRFVGWKGAREKEPEVRMREGD